MNDINWTTEARQFLTKWLEAAEKQWTASGADAEEVRDDLITHLQEHFDGRAVERDELAEVLERFSPEVALEGISEPVEPERVGFGKKLANAARGLLKANLSSRGILFWAAIWPLCVVILEWLSGACAGIFFAPLASPLHAALVIGSCLAAFAAWMAYKKGHARSGWLAAGFAMPIAGYYGLLLLPIVGIGVCGFFLVLFNSPLGAVFVIPLIALGVMVAGAAMWQLGALIVLVRRQAPNRVALAIGVLIAMTLLVLLEGPGYVSRICLQTGNASLLRSMGSEKILLASCYELTGGNRSGTDTTGWTRNWLLGNGFNFSRRSVSDVTAKDARLLYYRVTGNAFNSVEPPPQRAMGRNPAWNDIEFDPDVGGDAVTARLKGLNLVESRLDGHIDAASALGYWEWTITFANEASVAREARMQVLLPSGGVVSRLTLWVNGEPQEAAFSAEAVATKAYRSVAVVQQRDPVLVRWVAPDQVLVQCFPVPAEGEIKIRLGITAAIDPLNRFSLPRIIERNFGLTPDTECALWVQGDASMSVAGLGNGNSTGKWSETHGPLPVKNLVSGKPFVQCTNVPKETPVWTVDPFAADQERYLLRKPMALNPEPIDQLCVVVDGSRAMAEWKEAIVETLDGLPVKIYLAGDECENVSLKELADATFQGGCDNRAALRMAIQRAQSEENTAVLWLHGPQPVEFGSVAAISQLLERGLRQPDIWTINLVNGPNRILEELSAFRQVRRSESVTNEKDLAYTIARIVAGGGRSGVEWQRSSIEPTAAIKVWDQLARWHAWQQLRKAARGSGADRSTLTALATRYQLVTPWSAAVVLETKKQFEDFGLSQVDPSSTPQIPVIPEPTIAYFLAIAGALFLARRRR